MQGALSRLRSWELNHKQEDVRGWPLRDADGHVLGTVGELIVDTDSKHVTQVVLRDGKRYAAHDVLIGNHVLLLGGNGFAKAEASRMAAAPAPAPVPAPKPEPLRSKKIESSAVESGDLVVPLVDEEIEVSKRQIDAGGVRVRTHIVEKPFDQEVRLRDEHVDVERRRVDQPLSAAEAEARLHDRSIEVAAKGERATVEKRAHVVEEVVLKKQAAERVERIRDTVRHTEAEISELPGKSPTKLQKGS